MCALLSSGFEIKLNRASLLYFCPFAKRLVGSKTCSNNYNNFMERSCGRTVKRLWKNKYKPTYVIYK